MARGKYSFLTPRNQPHVERILSASAAKYGVRIYRFANVGNHIHLLILIPNRNSFRNFIRELSGRIAATVTGSRKSHPLAKRFWDFIPFTRIISWGREFKQLGTYFIKNLFEAEGLYSKRAKALGYKVISITAWAAAPS